MRFFRLLVAIVVGALSVAGCNRMSDPPLEQDYPETIDANIPAKDPVPYNALRNVFWGDLHIHSRFSFDAYTMGVVATADDAYTYARGGTIAHALGYPIRASRPLDFAAVTDHSEYFGVAMKMDPEGIRNSDLNDAYRGSKLEMSAYMVKTTMSNMTNTQKREEIFGVNASEAVLADTWAEIVAIADANNEPGVFTAFAGYEWSSMPDDQNLHRNVIYRGNNVPAVAFSSRDSDNPEDLWQALDEQREQGMYAIAIPHNSNVSNGLMYQTTTFDGGEIDATYTAQRMRNEPVTEMLQVKGASETHPILSSEDEFADFEIVDMMLSQSSAISNPKGGYVRDALRTGMEMAHRNGLNPYQFGFIGASDGHNSSSPVEEDNYHGKLPLLDGSPAVRSGKALLLPEDFQRGKQWSAMGLAGVWAEENTRESLFDAMVRRETYATSGPRISLRMFGGFGFSEALLQDPNAIGLGYEFGVPMGGELKATGDAPSFLVWAARDPMGANLDRLQIIKLWVDSEGNSHERIYDVASADDRARRDNGSFEPVGNTVDVSTATYNNSIGGPTISVYWQDPDYDPALRTAYYARVLEIPTPRWTTFDAIVLGIEPPEPATLQERAISSAVWIEP